MVNDVVLTLENKRDAKNHCTWYAGNEDVFFKWVIFSCTEMQPQDTQGNKAKKLAVDMIETYELILQTVSNTTFKSVLKTELEDMKKYELYDEMATSSHRLLKRSFKTKDFLIDGGFGISRAATLSDTMLEIVQGLSEDIKALSQQIEAFRESVEDVWDQEKEDV